MVGLTPGLYLIFFFLFCFHVVGLGPLHPPGWPGGLVGCGLLEHECGHGELGVVEVVAASADVKGWDSKGSGVHDDRMQS